MRKTSVWREGGRGRALAAAALLTAALALAGCDLLNDFLDKEEETPNGTTEENPSEATFVAVSWIAREPEVTGVNNPLRLSGTVTPKNATRTTIMWSLKDAGETGATLSEGTLTAAAAGEVIVTATVVQGKSEGVDYTQDFTVPVIDPLRAREAARTAVAAVKDAGTVADLIAALEGVPGVVLPADFAKAVTSKDFDAVKKRIQTGLETISREENVNLVAQDVNALNKYLAGYQEVTPPGRSPAMTSVEIVDGNIAVSWEAVFGATSYEVYTASSSSFSSPSKYGEYVSTTSAILTAGAEWTYVRVKAKNSYGTSGEFSTGAAGRLPLTNVTLASITSGGSGLGTKNSNFIYAPVTLVFAGSSRLDDTSSRLDIDTSSGGNWSAAARILKDAGYSVVLDFSACKFVNGTVSSLGLGVYLRGIVLPDKLTSIGAEAFRGCTGLTSLTIPSSVTSIGECAFYGCTGLTGVTIPASVTTIGNYAFSDCASLAVITTVDAGDAGNANYASEEGVLFNKDKTELVRYPAAKTGTTYTIPSSVTAISGGAFSGCAALAGVTIPSGVTAIGSSAFQGCAALASVAIPEGVTTIGSAVFSGCAALTRVTIPNSVTSINDGAFSGCSALTSVTIPSGVAAISAWTFDGCTGLASVTIPADVASIGYQAFYGCAALTGVTFVGSDTVITSGSLSTFPGGSSLLSAGGASSSPYKMAAGTYTRESGGSTWTKQN